jgi:hypothetical protein
MIQMGLGNCPPGDFCDARISIENLMLDGFSLNINGIGNATTLSSYIDHVTMYRILGTGLVLSSQNWGPYTNITFDSGPSALSTTTCANITGPNGLGIHGLTCIAITAANAAVYLDSSSNSIEDVRIAGFLDGVLVGSQGAAQSNVLLNIFGDTIISTNTPSPVNVIHLSGLHTVTDISIMGVNNVGGGSDNTIKDDLTSTTLADPYVAMYVLGKSANGGYSRFTTSPHAATWGSGASTPSGACGASSAGSLYSNTSGTGAALWVCPVGGGSWAAIR